jgi:hypothetical protein
MSRSAAALLVLGLLQMTGDLLEHAGVKIVGAALKAVGAATTASPAPKVFSASQGLETFSTRFRLEWTDHGGASHTQWVTAERYAQVRGPYNRRNVYGAALAFGPVLETSVRTRPMFHAVAAYALCGDAPLLRELDSDPADVAGRVRVSYEPRPGTHLDELPRAIEIPCL